MPGRVTEAAAQPRDRTWRNMELINPDNNSVVAPAPGLCSLPQLGLDQELVSLTLLEKVSHTPVRKQWEDKI